MEYIKESIAIDKAHIDLAPDYIKDIIRKKEGVESNSKLIHIEGESYCYPDGEIMYDLWTMVFASTAEIIDIFKVSKWVDMPPNINKIWLSKKEVELYFKLLSEVDLVEKITKRNGA